MCDSVAIPLCFCPVLKHSMSTSDVNPQTLEQLLVPKSTVLENWRNAIEKRQGFAASKLGNTEKHLLAFRMLLEKQTSRRQVQILELWLRKSAAAYAGLFPGEKAFYESYSRVFQEAVSALDVIGISSKTDTGFEGDLVNHFQFPGLLTRYKSLSPDRSIPADDSNCFLPALRGKRILIVNPFAKLLAARATREIFEGVWRVAGKQFFEPSSVQSIEFPYGFARETWRLYPSTLELQHEVEAEIDRRDYDIALIGAGGMGIPLAAHVKQMGKVALVLGGYLQIVFGVKGNRWNTRAEWRDTYYNEWWIDMPEAYRPKRGDDTGDYSYW